MNRIVAFLQARMKSTRLPGKVLMPLQGRSVIGTIIERLKKSRELSEIIILTSVEPEDDALCEVVKECGVPFFRGDEDDVLDRFYKAALYFNTRHIARLTGDCPLIDPGIVDRVINFYKHTKVDLVSNQISESYPDGLDVCVFSFKALEAAWKNATLTSDREHVVPWIIRNAGKGQTKDMGVMDYPSSENLFDHRWTLDEPADLLFFRELAEVLPVPLVDARWQEILKTLKKYPEIRAINGHIQRNEGYRKSLERDKQKCL
jgi:spore coat polysaccharide biosynthesis protein SpsF (cytidylyltransferase family)